MTDGLLMPSHLIILTLVALVLFGPKRLPEIGRSLGTAMRGLREGLSGADSSEAPKPETGVERALLR
jgi:sec-independent protein translocase protein TatA